MEIKKSVMNIQNISDLSAQLKEIGFDNMGYPLAKRICLLPEEFIINEKQVKENEQIVFNFHFQRDKKLNGYLLVYYDAILQKEIALTTLVINGVDISELQEGMNTVDWKMVFDFNTKRPFNPDDKLSYENEQKIEQLMTALSELELTDEGKQVSILLKQKCWSEIQYNELMGNITSVKSKAELSQRFYYAERQACISADEAYRFLQNKWLEKQLLAKRKQQEVTNDSDAGEESKGSSESGLLKKKRVSNSSKNKRTKSSHD
jgi:hypothetical protein